MPKSWPCCAPRLHVGNVKSKAKMDKEIAEYLLAEHSENEDEEMGDDEREELERGQVRQLVEDCFSSLMAGM